ETVVPRVFRRHRSTGPAREDGGAARTDAGDRQDRQVRPGSGGRHGRRRCGGRRKRGKLMAAAEEQYDPRRETLVMETRTNWDPELGNLSDDDKAWLARAVHEQPDKAAKIAYER